VDKARGRELLRKADFRTLFIEELGWDRHDGTPEVTVQGKQIKLVAVAHKRGMVAYHCPFPSGEQLPDSVLRRKIGQQVAKVSLENFVIFTDARATTQVWQWARREAGKPVAYREHAYHGGLTGDALIDKLAAIEIGLEEEGAITLTDVTARARAGFDVEKVTKRFYERFQTEHRAFLDFISGIQEVADREWYASVMLNRLMFVYFIQRKGFLAGDRDYLRNRLSRMREQHGRDKFYSFYRYFLLRLFHEGLGSRERSADLESLLGRIPYLNGGLFDIHELEQPERYGKSIKIPDEAFERIFDFFDRYQWHLDERPLRQDDEINPDVLGYIFEKYINQKQMGAYYSKEDITGYIAKNTVVPFLFDAARGECKVAFDNPNGPTVWDLLCNEPDRYIYPAVRHGISWRFDAAHPQGGERLDQCLPLPEEIAAGLNPPTLREPVGEGPVQTLELRKGWNRPAPPEYALPTETWREVVARRERYEEVRTKLAAGEVRDVNNLITLNLDICQLAEDAIANSDGPELLRAFWHAIERVTILDPTCGSGAFLFAALNILEPLYEACLDRMEAFVEDLKRSGEKHRPEKYKDFREVLANVAAHPNRRYFILKSIILNNLFGVDIMEEAVEICKLRLFLKLAAQVEPDDAASNLGIEPLPDVDFNIRPGNTLIGYATYDEAKAALTSRLDLDNAMEQIAIKAADLQLTFDSFRQCQIRGDGSVPTEQKQELRRRLKALDDELNRHLARDYGVMASDKRAYTGWLKSHQPFHWFIEYHGIMSDGGFDVIIGNPPYVELPKVKAYSVPNFRSKVCGNLYCPMVERFSRLGTAAFRIGVIIPLSISSTERMQEIRNVLISRLGNAWISHFSGDANPSKLFEGVKFRLDILLGEGGSSFSLWSSQYLKWFAAARPYLFSSITYASAPVDAWHMNLFPKLGSGTALRIVSKVRSQRPLVRFMSNSAGNSIYVHRVITMFVKCFSFVPHFRNQSDGVKRSEDYKPYAFSPKSRTQIAAMALNSSTFFVFFTLFGDCLHCGKEFVSQFPLDLDQAEEMHHQAAEISKRLMQESLNRPGGAASLPSLASL
jgi:hypothetical protein